MTIKPPTADGYDLATTRHARATCLYVATKLGDLMDKVVVIGGLVRRSKSDQRGHGAVQYLRTRTANRLRTWMSAGRVGSGALFRAVDRWGRVSERGLGPDSVRAAIKRRAKEAGIEGRVSGHSLRVGSAQELAERGASLAELQKDGRWKDPSMPALYIRNQDASRGAVARLRGGASKKSKKALAASETVVVESG